MQSAHAHQLFAHVPQGLRTQFKPDQEQHQHHAELGKLMQIGGFRAGKPKDRPHQNARPKIAEHGSQAQPRRKRHHDDSGTQIDRRLQQKAFHADHFLS